MNINLHKNARTTPAVRQEMQSSPLGDRALAKKHGVSRATARKWKGRTDTGDASHRPHTLHTTLTPAQESIVVCLRRSLLLSLDDLVAVTREFLNPGASRSGLDRCLRRHGAGSLRTLRPAPTAEGKAAPKRCKDYEPGFIHVDVKCLPAVGGEPRRYLFAAVDRATRWVFIALKDQRAAQDARDFLRAVIAAAPFRIQKCLTDNGPEFTDRFQRPEREPSVEHAFERACTEATVEHRPIPPRHPQTDGMVERFNGRIQDVLQTRRFDSGEGLESTLHRYVAVYNRHIPQRALGHIAPEQAIEKWRKSHPNLFHSKDNNLTGPHMDKPKPIPMAMNL